MLDYDLRQLRRRLDVLGVLDICLYNYFSISDDHHLAPTIYQQRDTVFESTTVYDIICEAFHKLDLEQFWQYAPNTLLKLVEQQSGSEGETPAVVTTVREKIAFTRRNDISELETAVLDMYRPIAQKVEKLVREPHIYERFRDQASRYINMWVDYENRDWEWEKCRDAALENPELQNHYQRPPGDDLVFILLNEAPTGSEEVRGWVPRRPRPPLPENTYNKLDRDTMFWEGNWRSRDDMLSVQYGKLAVVHDYVLLPHVAPLLPSEANESSSFFRYSQEFRVDHVIRESCQCYELSLLESDLEAVETDLRTYKRAAEAHTHQKDDHGNQPAAPPCTPEEFDQLTSIHNRFVEIINQTISEDDPNLCYKRTSLDEDLTEFWTTLVNIGIAVGISLQDQHQVIKGLIFAKEIAPPKLNFDDSYLSEAAEEDIRQEAMGEYEDEIRTRQSAVQDFHRIIVRVRKCFNGGTPVSAISAATATVPCSELEFQRFRSLWQDFNYLVDNTPGNTPADYAFKKTKIKDELDLLWPRIVSICSLERISPTVTLEQLSSAIDCMPVDIHDIHIPDEPVVSAWELRDLETKVAVSVAKEFIDKIMIRLEKYFGQPEPVPAEIHTHDGAIAADDGGGEAGAQGTAEVETGAGGAADSLGDAHSDVILIDACDFSRHKTFKLLEKMVADSTRKGIECPNERTLRGLNDNLRAAATRLNKPHYAALAATLEWEDRKAWTSLPVGKVFINPKTKKKKKK